MNFHLIFLSLVHCILYIVSFSRMKSFDSTTSEDFEGTRFGAYLLAILQRLEFPTPRIKGFIMKKMHKEGTWGIKALQPGKEGEDAIVLKFVSDTKERGINLAM